MADIQTDDLVLVAILGSPRDLEIARVLGWYRIPVQPAPKTVRVDWLAFYLTAAFGEERWSVRYLAQVKGFELLRRCDLLRDEELHPRAEAPYFKRQLGPLMQLERPILADGWQRFTFLYTTGARLKEARSLRDLTIPRSQTRARLWRLLRERHM